MSNKNTVNKNAHGDHLQAAVIQALENIKATDIQVIDVSDKTSLMDSLIIASGTSSRHIAAVVSSVSEDLKKQGFYAQHQEGQEGSDWVLLDFTDIVLHVMLPEARELYDLENLWAGMTREGSAE